MSAGDLFACNKISKVAMEVAVWQWMCNTPQLLIKHIATLSDMGLPPRHLTYRNYK
jgi:hypothetical protein